MKEFLVGLSIMSVVLTLLICTFKYIIIPHALLAVPVLTLMSASPMIYFLAKHIGKATIECFGEWKWQRKIKRTER